MTLVRSNFYHTTLIVYACMMMLVVPFYNKAYSQSCPPNIDFEKGTLDNWQCYVGNTVAVGGANEIYLTQTSPTYNRHTMHSSGSNAYDVYGNFPVTCPNGSGYSVQLGNDLGGGQAEGISYTFTIPANENAFSLIYNYAVVFQAPGHRQNEQP